MNAMKSTKISSLSIFLITILFLYNLACRKRNENKSKGDKVNDNKENDKSGQEIGPVK